MPIYETVFAVPSILSGDEQSNSVNDIEELIKKAGGKINSSESMGEKKMAYIVKGHERAYYHLINFESTPDSIENFKKYYRINSNKYIRNMIVKED